MKKLYLYLLSTLIVCTCSAQYYLRGEIKDERSLPINNVRILLHSNQLTYFSNDLGNFSIAVYSLKDSITVSLDGYESQKIAANTDDYISITLKLLLSNANQYGPQLTSIVGNVNRTSRYQWAVGDESYSSIVENKPILVSEFPTTGFSLNVNKAAYSNVRRFINTKTMAPPDAVRIEEMLNYFNLHYSAPKGNRIFEIESQISDCPWNEKNKLLYLNLNASKLNLDSVPPSNLVFLIDVSGSMDMPNRLPLVKAAFQMLVKNLREKDTVSIVIYGGAIAEWLPPTGGAEKLKIIESIERLWASGNTAGESAIKLAYKTAKKSFMKDGNNRVVLATDGDFNVGAVSEDELEALIFKERQSGVYLTCLGVGMGNFKDSKLEVLAKKGNGNYAYFDDLKEAEKVLVKEITQTFYSVADDAVLNVYFNPEFVKEYRLIGFDNKKEAINDTTSRLEGGEVGSGNSIMAVFELALAGEDVYLDTNKVVGEVSVKYNLPNSNNESNTYKYVCINNYKEFKQVDKDYQFAAAIVMFAMKLKYSKYVDKISWNDIVSIAKKAYNDNDYLQREFLNLLNDAKKLYGNSKRKK